MSKIALNSNASGTGVFTIASPNSDTDRTLTLPDESGTVLSSSSDYLSSTSDIESQVKTATNASGSAPIYSCRAWVNSDAFSIRGSGNVSSITDTGLAGQFVVNFSTSIIDNDYAVHVTSHRSGQAVGCADGDLLSTTNVHIYVGSASSNTNGADIEFSVAIFR